MQINIVPKVKICCISSKDEAATAVSYGANALGLVADMPSGPGIIKDDLIATIAKSVSPSVATFLLTSRRNADAIIEHHQLVHTNTIQIVDAVPIETYEIIRKKIPFVKLVQVIHVIDKASLNEALEIAEHADALLLDSGNPNLQVKELGGTGRTHNWSISRKIREQSKVPVFLAGGLHAGNVQQAIEAVEPFGLDLCSGVRTNGHLDHRKLDQFFNVINKI